MTATHVNHQGTGRRRAIGPLGTTARVLVGGVLVAGQWLRARRTPTPLRATGPVAHALNVAVFVVLYLLEPTSDAALLFYGASMWLAVERGYAGCEVLAVSNCLLGRDDQVGCALFWPIDQLEHHRTMRRA
jgi:hypothetical protein